MRFCVLGEKWWPWAYLDRGISISSSLKFYKNIFNSALIQFMNSEKIINKFSLYIFVIVHTRSLCFVYLRSYDGPILYVCVFHKSTSSLKSRSARGKENLWCDTINMIFFYTWSAHAFARRSRFKHMRGSNI